MSVHYKFKSALEYDTVTFDGLHISVKDLKNAIIQQKRIGKNTDFDLQVTNAQTKEVYDDENALIPKNTSLLIARIPTSVQGKSKNWEGYGGDNTPPTKADEGGPIAKAVDLSSLDAPEDDKIKAMMSQSTQDYDPSNYMKIRGANQMGAVPPNYRCYKCHQTGHWIKDCPLGQGTDPIEIKKSTGIPRSFMVPVEGPQVPGAMMTPNGSYAVPVLDHQAYTQKPLASLPVQEPKPEIPEDLVCSICSDLLTDAVMIPCCGNSFCDECIRSCLLESEDHECPDCHDKDISPGTLIPNRFLRNAVGNFKNTTGYVKKTVYKEKPEVIDGKNVPEKEGASLPHLENSDKVKSDNEEKTVISEADSTEQAKNDLAADFAKGAAIKDKKYVEPPDSIPEGPPGVSPRQSPKPQRHATRVPSREQRTTTSRPVKPRAQEQSPRKTHRHRRSPNFESGEQEDRPGTPTVDEPGAGNYQTGGQYNSNGPPGTMPPMMGIGPTTMPGPPPTVGPAQGNFAPVQASLGNYGGSHGPPPNFRLPPPGSAPPYIAPGNYTVPPRPMFDANRPPISGPPPGYQSGFAPGNRAHPRDFPPRRIRDRTPPGLIDDPLAAFNRMLREKDERERRLKQRNLRRSYSRSRSRSRSFSRSPRRMRSRSPRRRQSRSRSRSFSISRSRSRSYSGGSIRGSPYRQLSPPPRRSPPPLQPRRGPSRYRSPIRSPPRHHRQGDRRDRDFDHFSREERPYSRDKDRDRGRDSRDERDRDSRYYDFDDRRGGRGQWGMHGTRAELPGNDGGGYFPQQLPFQNNTRYQRDYPPYLNKTEPAHSMQPLVPPSNIPQRRFDDIAPPGVEEPPIPGLENMPRLDRYEREPSEPPAAPKEELRDLKESKPVEKREDRKRKHEKRSSRTPDRVHRNPSPKRKSKDRDSPEKHKRRRREASSDRDEKERKKDHSDEEKSRKSKDKKKKKERKESDKKKKRDKKDKHKKEEKDRKPKEEFKQVIVQNHDESDEDLGRKSEEHKSPEPVHSEQTELVELKEPEPPQDLYEDVPVEEVENYSKLEAGLDDNKTNHHSPSLEIPKDYEDSEKDVLELHTIDMDLKAELDKNEVLAPVPEKSKWEVDEEISSQSSPKDQLKVGDYKSDKSGKVTNEVLKRAENAIFAKAINAIRPIEIKKISTDRAKLYSGERDVEKSENKLQITVPVVVENKKVEAPPTRISVKERLGVKVDDDVVKPDKRHSRSLSPFSRRSDTSRNLERKVEIDERKHRRSRSRRRETSRDRHRNRDVRRETRRSDTTRHHERRRESKREDHSQRSRSKPREEEKKRRRSKTRSETPDKKDKRKKKEKKQKKEKTKKGKDDETNDKDKVEEAKPKAAVDKRKPTLDEANFEPDYDLESESEKEDKKTKKQEEKEESKDEKDSSSSESSSSSSDERKKKKHKKHRKKKRKESSSSSSESESESSDDEKDKRRRKHKKKQKKRKKSKHK